MARVKRGVTAHAQVTRKSIKAAKGYYAVAVRTPSAQPTPPSKRPAFTIILDRKRQASVTFRALWIQRINAAVRPILA